MASRGTDTRIARVWHHAACPDIRTDTKDFTTKVAQDPAVRNEYGLSNLRGTVAMAKLGNNPNSATSEFFFNLADNSSNLNNQNGGFTVFGRVVNAASQAVIDRIAAAPVPTVFNSPWDAMPLFNYRGGPPSVANLIVISSTTNLASVAVSSVSPATGQSAAQTFQFKFTDSTDWQNLDVVNILINNYLDGRNACYLAYSRTNNALYLVPDEGGGLLPGLVLNGTGSTSNKQCTVSGAGSSALGVGTTLTLTLNIAFSRTDFSGNKVIYLAARSATDNTGWETRGAWRVPGGTIQFPAASGVTPASGTGSTETFTFDFDDAAAGTNLQTMWGLINTAIDGRNACYFAYYWPANQLYLYPDNGDGTRATSIALAGTNSISNSQCTVSAVGSSVQVSGRRVTLTLPITFNASFTGPVGIWSAVQTMNGAQTSPWESVGNWIIP